MLAAIGSAYLIRNVVDRHRDQVVVINEHRSGEDNVQFNRTAGKGIIGIGCQYIYTLLLSHLDVGTLGLDVLEQTEVDVCTACGIVAVGRDDVLAGMKKVLQVTLEMQHNAVHPGLACVGHLGAIDVEFKHIIVRILHIQVLLQLLGCQFHLSADIDVAALTAKATVADVLAFCSPGSLLGAPFGIVEVFLLPTIGRLLVGYFSFPALFVRHGGNGSEHIVLLGTHETVSCSVHTQKTQDGFFVVGPVTSGSVSQLIVGRPDREIRVIHYQRHGGQT